MKPKAPKLPNELSFSEGKPQLSRLSLDHINDIVELSKEYLAPEASEFSEETLTANLSALWHLSKQENTTVSKSHAKKIQKIALSAFSFGSHIRRSSHSEGGGGSEKKKFSAAHTSDHEGSEGIVKKTNRGRKAKRCAPTVRAKHLEEQADQLRKKADEMLNLRSDSKNRNELYLMAEKLYLEAGKPEKAIEMYEGACFFCAYYIENVGQSRSESTFYHAKLARLYEQTNQLEKAVKNYSKVGDHASDPKQKVENYANAGELFDRLNQPDEAAEAYARAGFSAIGQLKGAYLLEAEIRYSALGKPEKAGWMYFYELERLCRRMDVEASALYMAAKAEENFTKANDLRGLISAYMLSLRFHSMENKSILFERSIDMADILRQSSPEKALRAYLEIADFAGVYSGAHSNGIYSKAKVNAGDIYLELNQPEEAADTYAGAAHHALNDEESTQYYAKAEGLYLQVNQPEKAVDMYKKAVSYHFALRSQSYAKAGVLYEQANQPQNAAGIYAKAASYAPNQTLKSQYFIKAGELYEQANQPENAAGMYENAASCTDDQTLKSQHFAKAGELYEQANQPGKAADMYANAANHKALAIETLPGAKSLAELLIEEQAPIALREKSLDCASRIGNRDSFIWVYNQVSSARHSDVESLFGAYKNMQLSDGAAAGSPDKLLRMVRKLASDASLSGNSKLLIAAHAFLPLEDALKLPATERDAAVKQKIAASQVSENERDLVFDTYSEVIENSKRLDKESRSACDILGALGLIEGNRRVLDLFIREAGRKDAPLAARMAAAASRIDRANGSQMAAKLISRKSTGERRFDFFAKKLIETGYLAKGTEKFLKTDREFLRQLLAQFPNEFNTTVDTLSGMDGFSPSKNQEKIFSAIRELGSITPQIFSSYVKLDSDGRAKLVKKIGLLKGRFFKNEPIGSILSDADKGILTEMVYIAYKPIGMSYTDVEKLLGSVSDRTNDLAGYVFPQDGYSLATSQKSYVLREGADLDFESFKKYISALTPDLPKGVERAHALRQAFIKVAKVGTSYSPEELSTLMYPMARDEFVTNFTKSEKEMSDNAAYSLLSEFREIMSVYFKDNYSSRLAKLLESRPEIASSVRKILSDEGRQKTIERQLSEKLDWKAVLESEEKIANVLSRIVFSKAIAPVLAQAKSDMKKFEESKETKGELGISLKAYISKNQASFFAKASAGICTASNTTLFNRPDHFHINIIENDSVARGNIQAYIIEKDGEKSLLLRGFNPNTDFVSQIDVGKFCEAILRVARQFKEDNHLAHVYITEQGNWHALSNRNEVASYLARYTKEDKQIVFSYLVTESTSVNHIYQVD